LHMDPTCINIYLDSTSFVKPHMWLALWQLMKI